MIFALGFLTAGLLALIGLPALWRRALRLTRRRLEMQLPLSPAEILAERDHVRAEAAIEIRRAEQRIEKMVVDQARISADLGRKLTEIAGLEARAAERDAQIGGLERDLAANVAALNEARGELGALHQGLHATDALLRAEEARHGVLREAHRNLNDLARQQKAQLGALELRVEGLQLRVGDLGRDLETARTEREAGARVAENLREEIAFLRRELRVTEQHRENLQARYEKASARIADLERAVIDAGAARQRAEEERERSQTETARESEGAVELRKRLDDMRLRLNEARETAQARERELAGRVERLRSEKAALEGALAAARSRSKLPVPRQRDEAAKAQNDIIPAPAALRATPLAAVPNQKKRQAGTPQQALARMERMRKAVEAEKEAEPKSSDDARLITR